MGVLGGKKIFLVLENLNSQQVPKTTLNILLNQNDRIVKLILFLQCTEDIYQKYFLNENQISLQLCLTKEDQNK